MTHDLNAERVGNQRAQLDQTAGMFASSDSSPPQDPLDLESGVRSYSRSFQTTFDRALGTEIWDVDGRRYLDFLAGAGSLNYGHNNVVCKQALVEYIGDDRIAHSLDYQTKARTEFLREFRSTILDPRGLDHVVQFTGPTGTNAVEAALKLARKVTGRSNVVSFTNGFHGVSLGALAMTGNAHHRGGAGVEMPGGSVVPYDGYLGNGLDTVDYFEKLLEDASSGLDLPAAVLLETVQGEGGLRAASNEWLQHLDSVCKRHGILVIVDDIQAGCGRTGTFFSFEPSDIVPDMVTLSKSLSGFGLPFAVLLLRPELDAWKPGEHNGTFRGNNHAFITATQTLRTYWRTTDFAESVQAKSAVVASWLERMVEANPCTIVQMLGRGLMSGLEFVDPDLAGRVCSTAFAMGLIIERSGPRDEVVKLLMPLTTPMDQLEEGLEILRSAFEAEAPESVLDLRDRLDHLDGMQALGNVEAASTR